MADLSQEEIDALISGEGEGEATKTTDAETDSGAAVDKRAAEVKIYDFRKPSPIPEEQKKTFALLHEQYAQRLKVNLSAFLRTEVEVSLENVEQMTFSQYVSSLNTPTCLATFEMPPLNGFGLIEANAIIAYSVIDRMLGGSGLRPEQVRPFTDVEMAIVKRFMESLLYDLQETWKSLIAIRFNVHETKTNPALVRIIPMKEITLVITLNIKVVNASGLITICIPYSNLEPLAFKLGSQQWNEYTKQSEEVLQTQKENFCKIPMELSAVLSKIDLSMEEVLALQVGDIVDLGHKTSCPISVKVGASEKFEANVGLVGKHKAFVIQNEIQKDKI